MKGIIPSLAFHEYWIWFLRVFPFREPPNIAQYLAPFGIDCSVHRHHKRVWFAVTQYAKPFASPRPIEDLRGFLVQRFGGYIRHKAKGDTKTVSLSSFRCDINRRFRAIFAKLDF